ncbi:DHH family phosphoesterase [Paenibacillus terrigena]|uniref:DHH family phosphoesterase n=1 Tax=Paenibacillus terrigena TaxID=369333 RepID=UPI0028D369C2|nr:DHH family phosphoesterase [Paenibacillus terrigena]
MPKYLFQRWHGYHMVWAFIVMMVMIVALAWHNWVLGVAGLVLIVILVILAWHAEKNFRKDMNEYIATLTYRVKRTGNDVINELPFGVVLYDEEKHVEWHNPYMLQMLGRETLIGVSLKELVPGLQMQKEKDKERIVQSEVAIGDRIFLTVPKQEERLIYFQDVTDYVTLRRSYEAEKLVIGIVMLDNLDELTQGLDDQQRAALLSRVTNHITEWAHDHQIYMKRLTSDRYLILLDHEMLKEIEMTRFVILDEVRELTVDNKLPLTLSIGIAAGIDNIIELGQLAQSSLDIALGRGGDQVAVREGQRLSFYGGKSNAVEKRTRVRVRVIAHALRDFMQASDKVIIMGHRMPDMDSVGAAIGLLKAAQALNVEAYIVLEGVNPSIDRMISYIKQNDALWEQFITPEQAVQKMTANTLAIVVDTHKASMVKEPRLLQLTNRVVVIDHHRRGEEFLQDAVLIYMEPYASSTCELVTELLQYIHDRIIFQPLEATVLLAGITVDTKNFSMRTGSRTFEAAGFLRRNGADTIMIQNMLKENLKEYIAKAEVMRLTQMLYGHIAVAVTEPERKFSQLSIAQVADTLLTMNDVLASFVISERPDGHIGISARSLGQMNVQVVMERLGGGGHLTNAAAQLDGTLSEAEAKLKRVLAEIDAEEGLFE